MHFEEKFVQNIISLSIHTPKTSNTR